MQTDSGKFEDSKTFIIKVLPLEGSPCPPWRDRSWTHPKGKKPVWAREGAGGWEEARRYLPRNILLYELNNISCRCARAKHGSNADISQVRYIFFRDDTTTDDKNIGCPGFL